QLAQTVFVEHPRQTLRPRALVVDAAAHPPELGLGDLQHQLRRDLPHGDEGRAQAVDRPLVDRIVGQVELVRLHGAHEMPNELLDQLRRERRLGERWVGGQPGGPGRERRGSHASMAARSSLTCVASLSPRPLTQMSTGASSAQRPRWDATHATACAVSSAGMIPSSRLNVWKPSSAWASVTETYIARPESLRCECSGPTPG